VNPEEERTEQWLTSVYERVRASGQLRQASLFNASLEGAHVAAGSSRRAGGRARRDFPSLLVGLAVGVLLAGALGGSMVLLRSHGGAATNSQGASTEPSPTGRAPSLPPGGWRVIASPSPRVGAMLHSVSCVSPKFCIAAGAADSALLEAWNGTAWSIVPSPSPGSGSGLSGVSCVSTTFCVAVGSFAAASGRGSLVDMWNGRSWTQTNVADSSSIDINSVSCSSSKFCAAVGQRDGGASHGQLPVNLKWDGNIWSIDSAPNVSVPLDGVSCVSAAFCMAVGDEPSCNVPNLASCPPTGAQLAESWNGARWAKVPMPATSGGGVYAVDCVSRTFCFAGGGDGRALAEAWDGSSWRVVFVPESATAGSFSSVSCSGPSACTLVASSQIQYWDGHVLTAVQPPPLVGGQVELAGVAVVTSGKQAFRVAVGDARFPTDPLVRTFVATHG
jgi:hypothetical protein